jgi:hypothetical protein
MRLSQLVRLVQAKEKFPTLTKKTSDIKWVCCSDPEKKTNASGQQVWMSWCMYEKGGQKGGMNRVVGRPKKNEQGTPVLGPKPVVKIDGRTIPKCPS